MMGRRAIGSVLVLAALLAGCASSGRVSVKITKPASVDMPGVKEIAIVDFQGPDGSGSQIATMVQSMLMKANYFDIMERDRLQQVLSEQNLGMSGIVDDATAVEVGKMLGVDALIFGEVTTYDVPPDKEIVKKVKEKRGTGKYRYENKKDKKTGKTKRVKKEIKEEVFVDKKHWVREGNVAINFRVVDVQTGKVLAAHTDSKSYNSDEDRSFWQAMSDDSNLKPKGEILNDLSKSISQKFVRMIAPYTVSEHRVIESGPGSIALGKKYAESGLWPEAQDEWKNAIQDQPSEPAGYYNLGLSYEVQGMFQQAEKLYREAMRKKQKKLYMNALARVRKLQKEQDKLDNQLMDR